MSCVQRNSFLRSLVGVFEYRKTSRIAIGFLSDAFRIFVLVFAIAVLSACATSNLNPTAPVKHQPKNRNALQSGRHQPSNNLYVHWRAPKFERIVDGQHVRVMLDGTADPGTKIKITPYTVSFDSQMRAHDLTLKQMAPSSNEITIGPDYNFKIFLTLPLQHVEIPFDVTLGPNKQQDIITMLVSKNHVVQVGAKPEHSKMQSRWGFGVEARSVAYSQTNKNNLTETMLAATLSYQLMLSKDWSFKTGTFMDLAGSVPFSTTQNEMSARFWGFHSDMIYLLPIRSRRWSAGIVGGAFYMTMFPSGQSFGYDNLWGPELYPFLDYRPNAKNNFDFYYKFAPVYSQGFISFSNHESDIGAEWTSIRLNKRTISVKLDLLQDQFIEGGTKTESSAVNLGITYGIP